MDHTINKMAKTPIITHQEYLKFGFCKTRHQAFLCPSCSNILNAGPHYQPKCCDQCGQPVDFTNVLYEEDEFLGYDHIAYNKNLLNRI
jgi:hypothetical protein